MHSDNGGETPTQGQGFTIQVPVKASLRRRVRRRKPKDLEQIVHEAVKEAILTGYDRGQVGVAMVAGAARLVDTWPDDDQSRVLDAIDLRADTLRNGISRRAWQRMILERESLALAPCRATCCMD